MGDLYIQPIASRSSLEATLRRRGHRIQQTGNPARVLFPRENLQAALDILGQQGYEEYFGLEFIVPYLDLFGHYSIRKTARRHVRAHNKVLTNEQLEDTAGTRADEYIELLSNLQILESTTTYHRLTRRIDNIGPSLEHYIAELLTREFWGTAEWGVILEGLPWSGGDYDVLAWLEPCLVYVECKSSRLSEISESEIFHFFQRWEELGPDLAVFLVDTDDRLNDQLLDKFDNVITRAQGLNDGKRGFFSEVRGYGGGLHPK